MRSGALAGCLGALLLAAPLACEQLNLGGSSELFSLAQRPAGARALALGGAFEALADDPSAVLWNPAAPAFAPGLGLSMHHETWLASTGREVLSVQAPVLPWLGLGLYGAMVNYGGSELRDANGASQGYFTPGEQSLGGTASLRWGQAAVGVSGRLLSLQLPAGSVVSGAGDLGLLWQPAPAVRVATVLKALPKDGGIWQASGVGSLSLAAGRGLWRAALASSVRLDPVAVSELDLGAELGYGKELPVALRVGFAQTLPAFGSGLDQRFSTGLGAAFGQYRLDYAFLPWGSFGATHRVSLSFEQPWAREKAEPAAAPTPRPAALTPAPTPQPTAAPTPQPAPQAVPPPQAETRFRVLSDAVVQARGLEAAGRVSEALKLYNQAARDNAQDLAAWKGMAGIYSRAGQAAYARQCWQQVLRLDPGDPDAQAALGGP